MWVSHLTPGMVFGMFAQFLTRQTAGNESYIYLTSKIQIISLSHALKVSEHAAECMSFELFMLWATGQRIFMGS